MNQLTILTQGNQQVVDSREVAEMVGKPHNDLMKSIRTYSNYISNQGEISLVDFFIESSYKDNKGEVRPCYLLTKKGCDMVANKMTGEKGVLFTAAYVTAFEQMREHIQVGNTQEIAAENKRAEVALLNTKIRIAEQLMALWNKAGITPREQAIALSDFYAIKKGKIKESPAQPQFESGFPMYDATMIVQKLGVLTDTGEPHTQVIEALISDLPLASNAIEYVQGRKMYAVDVVTDVVLWLSKHNYPNLVERNGKIFYISYRYRDIPH